MRFLEKISFVLIAILALFISPGFSSAQEGHIDYEEIVIDGITYKRAITEFQKISPADEGAPSYVDAEYLQQDLFPSLDGQNISPTVLCEDASQSQCISIGTAQGIAIGEPVYGDSYNGISLWQQVSYNGKIYYVPLDELYSGYVEEVVIHGEPSYYQTDQTVQITQTTQTLLNNQYYLDTGLLNTSTKTTTPNYVFGIAGNNTEKTLLSTIWNKTKSIFTPKRVYGIGQIALGTLQAFGGALQTELGGTIAVAGVGSVAGAVPGVLIGGGLIVLGGDNMIAGGSMIREGMKNIFSSNSTVHENYVQPIGSAIDFFSTPGGKVNTGLYVAYISTDLVSGSAGLMTKLAKFGKIIGVGDKLYNGLGTTRVVQRMSVGTASSVYNDGVIIGNKAIGKPQWLTDFIDTPDPQVWVSKVGNSASKSSIFSDLSVGRYGKNNEVQVIFDVPNADVSLTKGYKRNFDFTGTNELNLKLSDISIGSKTVSGYKLPADAQFIHNNAGILDELSSLFTNPFKAIKGEKLIDNAVDQTAYLRNLQEGKTLDEIAATSKEVKLGFESTANKIATKNGGTLVTSKLKTELSPDRAFYKATTDIPNFTDELRLSMVFDKTDDLYSSYVDIQKEYDVLRVKNSIKNTKTSGYQDVNVIVKNKNGALGEIQLIQSDMYKAKQIETPINNAFRGFSDENKILDQISKTRSLTATEQIKYTTNKNLVKIGNEASKKIYEPAAKAAETAQSKSTSLIKKVGSFFSNLFK